MAAGGQNAARLEVRVRGNAHQLLEKYKQLARDAHQAGDRVAAEYYLQHADHYFRVLNDSRIRQEEMRARRGVFDQFEDEPAGSEADEAQDAGEEQGEGGDRQRQQPRGDGDRGDRAERGDRGERAERSDRGERRQRFEPRERNPGQDGAQEGDRAERGNRDRWQDRRAGRDDRAERGERDGNRLQPSAAEQSLSDGEAALVAFGGVPAREAVTEAADDEAPKPRRRGRPRKAEAEPAEG
jgi:hypothetical protein